MKEEVMIMVAKIWIETFKDLLFGPETICPVCGQRACFGYWPGCVDCVRGLQPTLRLIPDTPFPCYCMGNYHGRLKELIADVKYHGAFQVACFLGELLGMMVAEAMILEDVNVIMPVPLHPTRERMRGFNQSALLADSMSRRWPKPIWNHMIRARQTQSQSELSGHDRWKNIEGAFTLQEGHVLSGKKIAVVDDILTTGATFAGVSALLVDVGARPIGLFVASGRVDLKYSKGFPTFVKR